MEYQKPWSDCYDMINQEKATEQSTTGGRSPTVLRNGYLKIGYQFWRNGEQRRKDFNVEWIQTLPINSCTFEQSKDLQEIMLLILQDDVLLPKGFTEYIYHVGNANELNSIRDGLIPGGTKPQKRKTSGLLHYSEPVGRRSQCRGNSMQLGWTKDRAIQEYLETPSKYSILVQFEARSREKGLQFYKTGSHAVVLCKTLPATCIEKAVCMKTQDGLYQKVRLTPRVPRVVLKSNSQYGQHDLQNQDARSSWEPSSDSKSHGETCTDTVDYQMSGIPLSAVEQHSRFYLTQEAVLSSNRDGIWTSILYRSSWEQTYMFKTVPIHVFLRIHPLIRVSFSFRGIVYSRHQCCICCPSSVKRV